MKVPGKCYLVGGAVRDSLLNKTVKERDWVVVGSSQEEMLAAGFRKIGKHFPVYLHPYTREEFALARSEEKSGPGHRGFRVTAHRKVTLEEDLARRDLTINAMAMDSDGCLVDPFNGKKDLKNGVLRHTTEAFTEDPLRCFRVARFGAALPEFNVAASTLNLIHDMYDQLSELPAERVAMEFEKAMTESEPARFFEVIRDADIGKSWFPELDVTKLATKLKDIPISRRGPLDVCWFLNPEQSRSLFKRLKTPNTTISLATLLSSCGDSIAGYAEQKPYDLLGILEKCRCFRDPEFFAALIQMIERFKDVNLATLKKMVRELASVRVDEPEGPSYGRLLRVERVERLRELLTHRSS